MDSTKGGVGHFPITVSEFLRHGLPRMRKISLGLKRILGLQPLRLVRSKGHSEHGA